MTYNNDLRDSDSVNLGSNPSPPATAFADVSGTSRARSDAEQPELPEHKRTIGRTETGTAAPEGLSHLRPRAFLTWAAETFGPVAYNRDERAARFIEEAAELVQVEGLSKDTVFKIIERVYSRTPGTLAKEIGQAAATLECLAENVGLSADAESEREFARVKGIPQEEWTRRHGAKVALQIANLTPRRSR